MNEKMTACKVMELQRKSVKKSHRSGTQNILTPLAGLLHTFTSN